MRPTPNTEAQQEIKYNHKKENTTQNGSKYYAAGAQKEFGHHLGLVSMYFEPYRPIRVEIKSIEASSAALWSQLLFFHAYEMRKLLT